MSDYAKMKNAELEALLRQRSLPHTGKKADMVARLQEADRADAAKPAATPRPAEDEIDWDDETHAAEPKSTAAPAATATATAAADIDPRKTDVGDLSVKPAESGAEQPKDNYSSGLKETTLDEELTKRKARAQKFGLPVDDEATKLLERAKKFGTAATATGPRGLNEALPERVPKRRRDAADDGNDSKRRSRGNGRRSGDASTGPERRNPATTRAKSGRGTGSWMTAEEQAKAVARKARFAKA